MSMTIEKAIDELGGYIGVYDDIYDYELKELWPALELAVTAMKEKAERENPAPLTIEELRQINGEPVWLDGFEWRVCYGTSTFRGSEYLETGMGCGIPLDGYGQSWFAYRHKPKEDAE